MSNTFKTGLKRYLSEVIVIFLGISISFWVDEWRSHRKEREIEHKMLENLKSNLEQDTLVLGRSVYATNLMVRGVEMLTRFEQEADIADSVIFYIDMAASYTGVLTNQTAYEEMKQTGYTRLIQDDTLKRAILGHYTTLIPYVQEWCEVDKAHTLTQLIPEMSIYFPVVIDTTDGITPLQKASFLKTPKLRHLLITNLAYKRETAKALAIANARTTQLIARIEGALEK
jgi:hypothetical protein